MNKLRPISPTVLPPQPPKGEPSTDSFSDRKLRISPLPPTSPPASHRQPSPLLQQIRPPSRDRILDFDMETLAAGYADPSWVPDKITCISASWIGEDKVHTWITGQKHYWTRKGRARTVLLPFYELLTQADVVTGHNIKRFDLRVFNAEAMRCGVEPIRSILVEDTMGVLKSKGFKKGLDNIAVELGVKAKKKTLNWAEWDKAYEDPTWREVIERCETDVILHKEVREEMIRRGWLRKTRSVWRA